MTQRTKRHEKVRIGKVRHQFSGDEGDEKTWLKAAKKQGYDNLSSYVKALMVGEAKAPQRGTSEQAVGLAPWLEMSPTDAMEVLMGTTLTKAQRAFCLVVYEGKDPIDLADGLREIALQMFGCERVHVLPVPPQFLVCRFGRGSGKTSLIAAARGLYRMLTADISRCGKGDKPAVAAIAPRGDTAKNMIAMAREMAEHDWIRPLLVASSKWEFTIRRPHDGKDVVFRVYPKGRGGVSVRGYSFIDTMIDEAEFLSSNSSDAVVRDKDLLNATTPRLLPDARVTLVSTPWPAVSECAKYFEENFGHPKYAIAAWASTPMMRDNDPHTMGLIAADMARDPQHAEREYYCRITDGAAGMFFEVSALERMIRHEPYFPTKVKSSCGIDPAFVNDSFGCVVVERFGKTLMATGMLILRPEPKRPLIPSDAVTSCCDLAKGLGSKIFATDTHRVATVKQHATREGVQVYVVNPEQSMIYLRDVIRENKISLPDTLEARLLISQLRTVTFRPKPGGGIAITQQRSREAGHGDLVSALANAVWLDRRHGPLVTKVAGATAASPPTSSVTPFTGI
jgi:hypothetical protein